MERQPQREPAVRDEPVGLSPPRAQRTRRRAEDVAARAVELTQASEARRERDLGDREIGVVEKPAREMRARRARQAVRRHAELGGEEPAQMSCGHAEPRTELGLGSAVERTVEDQLHRPAHDLGPGTGQRLR